MLVANGYVHLSEPVSISPTDYVSKTIVYTDQSGNRIVVPLLTVLRLYGVVEFEAERSGRDLEDIFNSCISGKNHE